MLLGTAYEDVEQAFGGNLDPSKDQGAETSRLYGGGWSRSASCS